MRFVLLILIINLQIPLLAQSNKAKLANEYYQNGDFTKAGSLFKELQKKRANIPLIHSNYLNLLLSENDYQSAQKYLINVNNQFPNNFQYKANLAKIYELTGQLDKQKKLFQGVDKSYKQNPYQLSSFAQQLVAEGLIDAGIKYYLKSRELSGNPRLHALELAALFRLEEKKNLMIAEYLNYAESNPRNTSYIKNLFQSLLEGEDEKDILEKQLISKIQQNPNAPLYSDLLIWLEIQRKNFYGAFLQARALDKRSNSGGDESIRIARIAKNNDYWDDAIEIYEYVARQYAQTYNGKQAKREILEVQETKIKKTYPVDKDALVSLTNKYQLLYDQEGSNPSTLKALRNKALLLAFFLNDLESAIKTLNSIVKDRRCPSSLASLCKLDLGDIYLLDNQPWESTLLYSQVEKSNKESPLGYNAKLKNAKLNYYKGAFKLAKSHLDILKEATTRKISNDAIELSLLIKNNTAFDSTDFIMQRFANAELLIFQNRIDSALTLFSTIVNDSPGHSLSDEVYWQSSLLLQKKGQFEKAITYLDRIIDEFPNDILADDALFEKANIVARYLDNPDEAERLYTKFLVEFPGSMHSADARVRLRVLRGDLVN